VSGPNRRIPTVAGEGPLATAIKQSTEKASVGSGAHGTSVGPLDAHYAVYRTKAGDSEIVVKHTLGRTPQVVTLVSQEATPQATAGSALAVVLVKRNQWTANTFRATVTAVAGAVNDVLLTFTVG
jgi:hypothetical protein